LFESIEDYSRQLNAGRDTTEPPLVSAETHPPLPYV
jgi:hypothetical protein